MGKKEIVSWQDVQQYIDAVAEQLSSKEITGVYGIPRGGCVLAVMLSYRLNVPLLTAPFNNCVVVDDIADTGKTLLHYSENDSYYITTMYFHKQSVIEPDFWYKEKTDSWVVYPWEEE